MASTNNPTMEIHHSVLRPTRSDQAPANGMTAVIATCPTMIRTSEAREDSPSSDSR
jgi:hypothetical protein